MKVHKPTGRKGGYGGCLLIPFLMLISVICSGQPPVVNKDSLQRVMLDSINRLIKTKMLINSDMIDSTFIIIKQNTNVLDWEKYGQYYQQFVNEMVSHWLDLNRRNKLPVKK